MYYMEHESNFVQTLTHWKLSVPELIHIAKLIHPVILISDRSISFPIAKIARHTYVPGPWLSWQVMRDDLGKNKALGTFDFEFRTQVFFLL